MTEQQINKLIEDGKKLQQEAETIVVDPNNNINLLEQLKKAKKSGNTEEEKAIYEKLRQNFITAGREDQLKAVNLDHELSTDEDFLKMEEFFKQYRINYNDAIDNLNASIINLKENAGIFQGEIDKINAEKATLELVGGKTPEKLMQEAENRKGLRKQLLEASITPEKELTDEQIELLNSWQKASERFLGKKSNEGTYTYIDKDGNIKKVKGIETIDTEKYPEYNDDIEFLGISAYKDNLEQVSAFKLTQDPYVFGEAIGKAYDDAEAQREGAGKEVLDRIFADKQKYVETFNGIPNPHKVKYENWKTAGSTLKGMKPVSRDLPASTRAKNVVENAFRFVGIRVPKFTRIDEHGNKVRDIKSGIGTLATDALVVGAVTASAITMGPAIAVAGYAAKGIVTVGNRIAARIEYARHKDEIDNNLPVIYQADSNAREVARKEYYRENGNNKFVAWAKAKSDKYFTRGRAKETQKAIAQKLIEEYSEAEDRRIEDLLGNVKISEQNQNARNTNQKQNSLSANVYNDIQRDPNKYYKFDEKGKIVTDETGKPVLDPKKIRIAEAAIARNAALDSIKPGKGIEDVNPTSLKERKEQYVKNEDPLYQTKDLNEIEDVEGPTSAITEEQIYTGRKQHVDRLNKVLTTLTTIGIKFGYTAWKNGFLTKETVHHDAVTKEETIHHPATTEKVEVTDYETQFDTSKTLDELRQNYAGQEASEYYSVSGGLRGEQTGALADKGITALWTDNKTAWGTGISDTHGLSAPVLTDKLVNSGLMDANGVLRQDITVQDLLDAAGATNADLSNLNGIYASVGDRYWVALSDLMKGFTKEVAVGSHIEEVTKAGFDELVTTVIKPAFDEEVVRFSSNLVGKALAEGAIAGAAIGTADALHEAHQTTYINGATPGRPDEVTPEAKDSLEVIAQKLQEQANKEREKKNREEEGR